jgi:hypothetical protein
MGDFFAAILAFPTVAFTIPLGVVLLYWLAVLLGGLDLDLLGGGEAGEAGDADAGADGVLEVLGLGGVPATFALSVLVFLAWTLCLLGSGLLGVESGLAKTGVAAASLGLAVPLAALAVKPLRRFFVLDRAVEHRSLVGKVCTVTTLRVDERYGQAEIADGGAGLLVQVRARPDTGLARGDAAIVYEYRDEVFWIAPLDRTLAEGTARPEEWTGPGPAPPRPAASEAAEAEAPAPRRGRETA